MARRRIISPDDPTALPRWRARGGAGSAAEGSPAGWASRFSVPFGYEAITFNGAQVTLNGPLVFVRTGTL